MTANDRSNQNPPDEFVLTPGGYRHKSLVHPVEAGVAVDVQADVIRLRNIETSEVIEEISPVPTAPGAVPAPMPWALGIWVFVGGSRFW